MRRSNFALRLQPSLMEEARRVAESEGVALNQLINVAVAEKISALRTEEYFRERGRRADRPETLRILKIAGKTNPPQIGDELPADWQDRKPQARRKGAQSASATRPRRRKSVS
jgi:HicB family